MCPPHACALLWSNIHTPRRPGRGPATEKNAQSTQYNKDIAAHTVRWAIVDWLDDAHQNGIWGVSYFFLHPP
jgi:hypothetical protein